MATGHLYYGFHRTQDGWVYREWAPGADALHLIGDFNGWNRESHPLTRLENGAWEIQLPGNDALRHGQRVKVQVTKDGNRWTISPYTFIGWYRTSTTTCRPDLGSQAPLRLDRRRVRPP